MIPYVFPHVFPWFPGLTFWSPWYRWIPSVAQRPAAGGAAPAALRLRAEAELGAQGGAGAGQRLRGGRIGGGSTWGAGETW